VTVFKKADYRLGLYNLGQPLSRAFNKPITPSVYNTWAINTSKTCWPRNLLL